MSRLSYTAKNGDSIVANVPPSYEGERSSYDVIVESSRSMRKILTHVGMHKAYLSTKASVSICHSLRTNLQYQESLVQPQQQIDHCPARVI